MKKQNWVVYLLYNKIINRTYVGASTDPYRRLKQHNGLLNGGPKATHAGMSNWELIAYLEGFEGQAEAYRWEKVIKMRASGLPQRLDAMLALTKGIVPEGIKKKPLTKLNLVKVKV